MNFKLIQWTICISAYLAFFVKSGNINIGNIRDNIASIWCPSSTSFILVDTPAIVELCNSANIITNVTSIVLTPNIPSKGENFNITIYGILSEKLNNGAYITLKVHRQHQHQSIKFPQIRFNACDFVIDGCPVSKMSNNITMQFHIQKLTPSGIYDIQATLFNVDPTERFLKSYKFKKWMINNRKNFKFFKDGSKFTCIQATIEL
jgi:hypothetical protein